MLPTTTYNRMIEKALCLISDRFDLLGGGLEEGSGSLSVYLGGIGEYLFNKQPASRQLWGSSPLTGPCRFDLVEDRWIHNKRGIEIDKYLDEEFKMISERNKKN